MRVLPLVMVGRSIRNLSIKSLDESKSYLSRSGWVGFIQKYFFAALIGSEENFHTCTLLNPKTTGIFKMGYFVGGSSLDDGVLKHEHRLFVGPKIRKDLMTRAENLELSIDMGWFWFLSQPIGLVYGYLKWVSK